MAVVVYKGKSPAWGMSVFLNHSLQAKKHEVPKSCQDITVLHREYVVKSLLRLRQFMLPY